MNSATGAVSTLQETGIAPAGSTLDTGIGLNDTLLAGGASDPNWTVNGNPAVLVSSGSELLFEHLPQQVREYRPACAVDAPPAQHDSLSHNREQLERNVIQRALANNGYSRARAASALGISRVTLYKKMKKYGLMRAPLRGSST